MRKMQKNKKKSCWTCVLKIKFSIVLNSFTLVYVSHTDQLCTRFDTISSESETEKAEPSLLELFGGQNVICKTC